MNSRRNFISKSFAIATGSMTLPSFIRSRGIHEDLGCNFTPLDMLC